MPLFRSRHRRPSHDHGPDSRAARSPKSRDRELAGGGRSLAFCRSLPCPFFALKPDGLVVDISDAAVRRLGYAREEVVGKTHFIELLPPEQRERVSSALAGLKQRGAPCDVRHDIVAKDGTVFPVVAYLSAMHDDHGDFVMSHIMVVDLSEIVQAERARAQATLRASEARFRVLADSAPLGIFVTDDLGGGVYLNPAYQRISGQTLEQSQGEGWREAIYADDRERVVAAWRKAASKREWFDSLHRFARGDGALIWASVKAAPMYDGDDFLGYVGIVEDINRRQAAEDDLRESEQRLREITDNLPAFISYMDREQRYRFANKVYEDWIGVSRDQIYGRTVREVQGEASYEQVREGIELVLAGNKVRFERDLRVIGVERDIEVTYVPHFGEDREVQGYYVLVYDITQNKMAAAALERSEAQFRALSESSPLGIFHTDAQGRCLYTNARWQEMAGIDFAASLENGWSEALHPDDRAQVFAGWQDAAQEGREFSMEFRWLRPGGEVHWVHSRAKPIKLADGTITGHVGTVEDITARKHAEQELLRSREVLRALSASLQSLREEERRRVVRELNDELGQELAALKMALHQIKGRLDDRESVTRSLDAMLEQIARILASTKRLSVDLRPSMLDQLGLVAALEWLTGEFSKHSGVPCVLRLSDEDLAVREPHATALFRVAQEALANVEAHAQATHATLDLLQERARIVLRVSDNGKGIGEADQRKKNCFGILSIRERAYNLDGEVNISGSPGVGTIVEVALPIPSAAEG